MSVCVRECARARVCRGGEGGGPCYIIQLCTKNARILYQITECEAAGRAHVFKNKTAFYIIKKTFMHTTPTPPNAPSLAQAREYVTEPDDRGDGARAQQPARPAANEGRHTHINAGEWESGSIRESSSELTFPHSSPQPRCSPTRAKAGTQLCFGCDPLSASAAQATRNATPDRPSLARLSTCPSAPSQNTAFGTQHLRKQQPEQAKAGETGPSAAAASTPSCSSASCSSASSCAAVASWTCTASLSTPAQRARQAAGLRNTASARSVNSK